MVHRYLYADLQGLQARKTQYAYFIDLGFMVCAAN